MLLHLFGTPHIKINGQTLRGLPAKAYVAVAMLVVRFGGSVHRPELASRLWEDHNTKMANANLRQMLAAVRRFETKYGISILRVDRNLVHLNTTISNDLTCFKSVSLLTDIKELNQYLKRYRFNFLERLEDVVGENLHRWILELRQEYFSQFLQVAKDSALHIGGKDGAKALEILHSANPYDEKLLSALILTYSQNRDIGASSRCFNRFAARLRKELGEPPSIKTLNLVARIAPELISDLEQIFLFLSKSPENISASIVASNYHSVEKRFSGHHLPRVIILPPKEGGGPKASNNALVGCLVEEFTLCLCRMRNFVVLAPHTAQQFVKLDQPQASFDVDYVISTRFMPNGNAQKLAVNLAFVPTGEVLLAEEIPIDVTGIFDSCAHLIQSIVNRIGFEIDRSVLSIFQQTGNVSAYTYFLIGKHRLNAEKLQNVRAARKAFRHALELAPDFYSARQMLAHTFYLEWFLLGRQNTDYLKKTQRLANELIRADPMAPGGHWELGISLLYLGDIDGALRSTSKAEKYAPHHADIVAHKADIFCHNGQRSDALKQIDFALELNPLPPDEYFWIRSGILFLQENYQQSIETMLRSKSIIPFNRRLLAACHAMLGNLDEANQARILHMTEYPDFKIGEWRKRFPVQERRDADHYDHALRMAGFSR